MAKAGHSFQLYVSLYIFDIIIFLTFNVMFKGGLIIPFGIGHFPHFLTGLKLHVVSYFAILVGSRYNSLMLSHHSARLFDLLQQITNMDLPINILSISLNAFFFMFCIETQLGQHYYLVCCIELSLSS